MVGENTSDIERHEILSDFRNFGNYNKYIFEESVRPIQVHMQENNLSRYMKSPPRLESPNAIVSPYPKTLGSVINQSSLGISRVDQASNNQMSIIESSFNAWPAQPPR